MRSMILSLIISFVFSPLAATANNIINTKGTEATVQVEGQSFKLSEVGKGLRRKPVSAVNMDFYKGELFVSDPRTFMRSDSGALASLDKQKAVALQLHFLRPVDSVIVQESLKKALQKNSVNIADPSVKLFMNALVQGGNVKENLVMSLVGTRMADGSEVISYETSDGASNVVTGSRGFIRDVFSIWLGKPEDAGLQEFKHELLTTKI